MSTQKIKKSEESLRIGELENETNNAIKTANDLLSYCEGFGYEIPFETVVKMVNSEMSETIVEDYVSTLYNEQPRALQKNLRIQAQNDLFEFIIHRINRNFEFVECVKGRAVLKKGAKEMICERFTHYIDQPEQIERYNRLQAAVKELNSLKNELMPFNPLRPFNLFVYNENDEIIVNITGINFG